MRLEVKSTDVAVKEGTSRAGRPYSIREQHAWLDTGKAYPSEVRIRLNEKQEAFPPGQYSIGPGCFWVDRYGSVQVDLAKITRADAVVPGVRPVAPAAVR